MTITYVGHGTQYKNSTSAPSVGVPAGSVAANDIVLVVLWTVDAVTITPPSGFSEVTGLPVSSSVGTTHLFWKRLTGADSGTYAFSSSASTYTSAEAFAFRGVVTTGSPWEADYGVLQAAASSANVDMDTTMPNTMGILICGANSGDEGNWGTIPTGWTAPEGVGISINFNLAYKALPTTGNTGSVSLIAPNNGGGVVSWIGALKQATPTLVATYTSHTPTNPLSVSVTVETGDVLVVFGTMEDQPYSVGTPSGGGLTYALQAELNFSSYTRARAWTATATSNASFTISATPSDSGQMGTLVVLRYGGSAGVGAVASTHTATSPSMAITTTKPNSSIAFHNGDWNALAGTGRTYTNVNSAAPTEVEFYRVAGSASMYTASYVDAGAAGSKTVGISTPSGQQSSTIAIEVLGPGAAQPVSTAAISASVAITASGLVGRTATATLALTASLTADGAAEVGPNQPATMPLAVSIAETHRKDTTGAPTTALAVAITATGATGKATSASMDLAYVPSADGLKTITSAASLSLGVAITADGLADKAASSSMDLAVAITAAGYKGSGATVATRWIRINAAWVAVPPTT